MRPSTIGPEAGLPVVRDDNTRQNMILDAMRSGALAAVLEHLVKML